MKIKLDKRLKTILSLINEGDFVADIGTDHGKIAVLAVDKTKMPVIATDISPNSLMKAQRLAFENDLTEEILFKVGDGLDVLGESDADTIVIAGMGGHEIINILTKSKFKYKKYILVPHQHSIELRAYLYDNQFGIERDFILLSDNKKFYQFFVVSGEKKCDTNYSPYELMFGLEKSDDFDKFKAERLKKLNFLKTKANGYNLDKIINEIKLLETDYESK